MSVARMVWTFQFKVSSAYKGLQMGRVPVPDDLDAGKRSTNPAEAIGVSSTEAVSSSL
jgi:hypothetical protein